jgi:hypothetical protein
VTLYRAVDCYAGGSDIGTGSFDDSSQSAGCVHEEPGGAVFQERLIPQTPGAASVEDFYGNVWTGISTQAAFPVSCTCTQMQDTGAGVSWTFALNGATPVSQSSQLAFVEG